MTQFSSVVDADWDPFWFGSGWSRRNQDASILSVRPQRHTRQQVRVWE